MSVFNCVWYKLSPPRHCGRDGCGERFPLRDALEKKFASEAVRAQVEQLQADDLTKLDTPADA